MSPTPRRLRGVAGLLVATTLLASCAGSITPVSALSPPPARSSVPAGQAVWLAPADFVSLSDVDPSILADLRYASDHNFVGRPITGYLEPLCILTQPAAEALQRVQVLARASGYSLKVYDCYRPRQAVDDFVRWAHDPADQRRKAEFYPDVDKSALLGTYIATTSAHSRGSTVDLTLVPLPAPTQRPYAAGENLPSCAAAVGQRFGDNSIDMGTGFDCFGPRAHTLDPAVTGTARANRLLLRRLMSTAGFVNYADEWWHYALAGEPYPDTTFDFPVTRAALSNG
jgi:D-alanyl-D-alanine dipeptidase